MTILTNSVKLYNWISVGNNTLMILFTHSNYFKSIDYHYSYKYKLALKFEIEIIVFENFAILNNNKMPQKNINPTDSIKSKKSFFKPVPVGIQFATYLPSVRVFKLYNILLFHYWNVVFLFIRKRQISINTYFSYSALSSMDIGTSCYDKYVLARHENEIYHVSRPNRQ